MAGLGPAHRLKRHCAIQSDQTALLMHRQRQQVGIGQLPVTQHVLGIEDVGLRHAQGIGPEPVMDAGAQGLQLDQNLRTGRMPRRAE